ncbi:MAG TPA: YfhH family protein [Metalysinibacillus jejuensis]|uniref:YfhH family protein n=1 Tax=Metalysinibacillus jejuensis TaxID=914327 RepID=A0A921NE47_9BACL|nr:YfhH family protein [Metalysinibacillus jejuensis]HJH11939.1 YfhH family protein [Metalysinibacillus jejuensis]
MSELYAAMDEHELRQEIANLKEKARKAEQLGIVNEFAVYERKALMAAAYLIDPATIVVGEMYRLDGAPGEFFKVDRLKGRFAWGYRLGSDKYEEAIPISMLAPMKVGK